MNPRVVVLLGCAMFAAPVSAKGSVFLNGVNIAGVTAQKLDNVDVIIDDKGNILITAKGYDVQGVLSPKTPVSADDPPLVPRVPVTHRYFLVSEISIPGLAQYDVDVFVNSVWVKRISSSAPPVVVEISRHLHKGKNTVHMTATKVLAEARKSVSPLQYIKIYVGEGDSGGNNVVLDHPLLEYTRDASETQGFSNEYALEAM